MIILGKDFLIGTQYISVLFCNSINTLVFGKAFVTDSPPRAIHLVFFGLQGIAFHIFRQNQSFFCLFFTVWTQKPFDGVRPFSPSWQDQKPLLQCGYETSGKNTIFSVLILYPFIVLPFVIITTTQKMEYY